MVNRAKSYIHEIPEGYEARIEGNKVIIDLRESEDERIREWLFNLFDSRHSNFVEELDNYNGNVTRKEILAWLEKQKEYTSDNFDDIWTTEDCGELLSEGEKLSPRFKELFKNVCHAWYDKGIEVGVRQKEQKPQGVYVDCTEHPEWYGMPAKEQKPTEWSEEDEKMLLSIINAFRNGTVSTIGQEQWLKSLPKRFNLQPIQEWSEEEYGRLFDIEHYLDGTLQLGPDRKIACIDFLKSLRPSWKPSEEQMKHLQRAINCYESDWGENKLLRSLIYDLKKLM